MNIKSFNEKIICDDQLHLFARILLFIFGLFTFLAPYELLIQPEWKEYFNLLFLICSSISLGAMYIGFTFIYAGLAAYNTRIIIDKNKKIIRVIKVIPNIKIIKNRFEFKDVEKLEVVETNWDSRPTTYRIIIFLKKINSLQIGEFSSAETAEQLKRKIESWLF